MNEQHIDILATKIERLHADIADMRMSMREMASAITKLAVVEERQAQTAQGLERAFKAIERVEERVARLEELAPSSKSASLWIDRTITAIVATVLVFVARAVGLIK